MAATTHQVLAKKALKLLLAAFVVTFVGGCSSVKTQSHTSINTAIGKDDRFQLKVRTGSRQLNRIVYELAYQQFTDLLPLSEREPYTGSVEITFASSDEGYFMSRSTSDSTHEAQVEWYTGRASEENGTVTSTRTTRASGGFIWQNSTMFMVVRGSDGERIWSADYAYKGGWEMSGFVVNTPEEAARLVLGRLHSRLKTDRTRVSK